MGSGSSAITAIISELEGFVAPNGSFEYIFMHCPDGLFDLEDKLFSNNNALRSDEAIYRFKGMMKNLYDLGFFWPGSYKKYVSNRFLDYVNLLVDRICTISFNDSYWYYQEMPVNTRMRNIYRLNFLLKLLSRKKANFFTPLSHSNMIISIPCKEDFFEASKTFLNSIYRDLGYQSHNLILDQLLLPHNLLRLDNYFDNDTRVIVVDRDPRDIFILNKYFWSKTGDLIPYPFEVNDFIKYYKRIRESEPETSDNRIHRIHFEDLIYDYDSCKKLIYSFIGADNNLCKEKTLFNPDISINNTQVYMVDPKFESEAKIIEKELSEYLYPFPPTRLIHNPKMIF